jgi:hypothetical protein
MSWGSNQMSTGSILAFFSWNGIFDKGPQDEGLFSFKEVLKTVQ